MRPPSVIEPGRLIAGRHPSAGELEDAARVVRKLVERGVTLFLDLTHDGELEPYGHLVEPPVRRLSRPIRDLSVPPGEALVETLDVIDTEVEAGGLVYLHCWAGCGRTGVVAGCWLVRHGAQPEEALARIAETRGLGCPQTLEQRLTILSWAPGR